MNHHKTTPVRVWVDVDLGIAEVVLYLNSLPGIRTYGSCQGTIDEGGNYPANVMATWPDEHIDLLESKFDVAPLGNPEYNMKEYGTKNWGWLYAKGSQPRIETIPTPKVNFARALARMNYCEEQD